MTQNTSVFALAAVAIAFVTAPVLGNETRQKYAIPAECVNAGNKVAQLECGTAYFKKKTSEANERGAAADKRISESQKLSIKHVQLKFASILSIKILLKQKQTGH